MKSSQKEYTEIRKREAENKAAYDNDNCIAKPPHTICFSVNNNCFMRCKMCDVGSLNSEKRKRNGEGYFSKRYAVGDRYTEFELEKIQEIVDEVSPYYPIIKTNFVEPLLCKNIRQIAEYVKSKGLKYYTITNGWMLKKHAEWLSHLPANVVRVSLDGISEVHDRIRGIKGSYERTIDGIKELLRHKQRLRSELPIIGICFTISNFNYSGLLDFMVALDREGILPHVYINFNHLQYTTEWEVVESKQQSQLFQELTTCSVSQMAPMEIQVEELSNQMSLIKDKFDPCFYHYYFSPWLKASDLALYYDPKQRMFPGTPCYLPWYAAQIGINGDVGVYGHCILPPFGNVFESDFMSVWNSEKAISIRKELKSTGSFAGCNRCIGTLYPLRGRN